MNFLIPLTLTHFAVMSRPTGPYESSEFEHSSIPEVQPLRSAGSDGNRPMSEFQSELVSLAAAVNGECFQSNSSDESSKKMAVKEADQYVKSAFAKFLRKSRAAARLDADESSIV